MPVTELTLERRRAIFSRSGFATGRKAGDRSAYRKTVTNVQLEADRAAVLDQQLHQWFAGWRGRQRYIERALNRAQRSPVWTAAWRAGWLVGFRDGSE